MVHSVEEFVYEGSVISKTEALVNIFKGRIKEENGAYVHLIPSAEN